MQLQLGQAGRADRGNAAPVHGTKIARPCGCAAADLGQHIEIVNATTETEIDSAFAAVMQHKIGALIVSAIDGGALFCKRGKCVGKRVDVRPNWKEQPVRLTKLRCDWRAARATTRAQRTGTTAP
jgi:hypothetical protein